MKIKYNIKDDKPLRRYNESMGIALFKDSILKNRKLKFIKYTTVAFIELLVALIFFAMTLILSNKFYCLLSNILLLFSSISLVYMAFKIIVPLCMSLSFMGDDEGQIEIDERGISFYFDEELILTLGWMHLKGVIIGEYSINFITDNKYYFYIDTKQKKEVVKAIKEYQSNTIIVR